MKSKQGTPSSKSPAEPKSGRGRRRFRFCLRWTCIIFGLLIAGIIGVPLYLNQVGVPEHIKNRLITELRQHGWDVQFSRLYYGWRRGIIAEDLQLQRTNHLTGPQLFIAEAECPLSLAALRRFKLEPTFVQLRDGRLSWAVEFGEKPRRFIDIRDLNGRLQFNPDHSWQLHSLSGSYRELQLRLSGSLTHADAIRDWTFAPADRTQPSQLDQWLDRVESIAQQITVEGTPELYIVVHGNARTFQDFHAGVVLRAPEFQSPWGQGKACLLSANLITTDQTNDTAHAEMRLTARDAVTPWAEAESLLITAQLAPSWTEFVPTNAAIEIELDSARIALGRTRQLRFKLQCQPSSDQEGIRQTEFSLTAQPLLSDWGRATNVSITGQLMHSPTAWFPAMLDAQGTLERVHTRWGRAQSANWEAHGSIDAASALYQTNLPWAQRLAELHCTAAGQFTNVTSGTFRAERTALELDWEAPKLHAKLSAHRKGHMDARIGFDTATHDLAFEMSSNLTPEGLSGWLDTNAPTWLRDMQCRVAPRLRASGQLRVPRWTNQPPDWWKAVLPTLNADAHLDFDDSSFRGREVSTLRSTWYCTNSLLRLSQFNLESSEGSINGQADYHLQNQDISIQFLSRLNPHFVAPLFPDPKVQKVFQHLKFNEPPHLQAIGNGNLTNWQLWNASAQVAITNFAVNGESAQDCVAAVTYTNLFLSIIQPQIQRPGERGVAEGIGIDLQRNRLFLTNAVGNLNAYAVLRAINTNTARVISQYQFDVSPSIEIAGVIGLVAGDHAEDLKIHVNGGPFHWHMFNLPHIDGDVHVLGETAHLTNVIGQFYDGQMEGGARFNWSNRESTAGSFFFTLTNASLQKLMKDVSSETNNLEGLLGGFLEISELQSADTNSWQGRGHLDLEDGLIWDIPVFGIVSEWLNSFIPGVGNNRAKHAEADFIITNSVIYTKDLDIRATGMRVHFDGTIGFDESLDAQVEAELLRDMPAVGYVFSKVLMPVTKLFVLKVTGTWSEPKSEPLYIVPNLVSKIILVPFRPLSTLKGLFTPQNLKNKSSDKTKGMEE